MKSIFSFIALLVVSLLFGQVPLSDPLFRNSVVSNNIDFIRGTDDDAFISLSFIGRERKEMPDSRNDNLFDRNTFIFEATFSGRKKVEIWCHSSFGNQDAAKGYADKLAPRLGKLPSFMRDKITHVVVHKGDAGAFGENEFFVLYSDNMDVRISNNDLEETVFHESVHASLDNDHASSPAWRRAQRDDRNFITNYAESLPDLEDLAETALFAYTLFKYPGRLPANVENWAKTHIPNRLAYLKDNVFSSITPIITNSPPMVSVTSPANGAEFELGQEIMLSANASDPDGNLDKVNFFVNGTIERSDAERPFAHTFTPTAVGTYTIMARAVDRDNARTDASVTITVVEKNEAPIASFIAPTVSTLEEGYTELYVNVDATDPDGDDISVLLKIDGADLRLETVAPYEWGKVGTPNSSETLGLTIGDHTLEAIVTDAKGLSTTISKTITVDRITAVSSLLDRKALLVFPNPSREGLFHLSEALEYHVLNANGAVILKGFGDIIDLSKASEGIYLLKADGGVIQLIK